MSDTRTYCFGRFLIDLPGDAEVQGQRYDFMFGQITSRPIGEAEFASSLKEREEALKAGKHKDDFKLTDVRLTANTDRRIFIVSDEIFGKKLYEFEAYRWVPEGVAFSITQGPYDGDAIGTSTKKLEGRLLPNLRARDPDEIPAEPGFCIKDGFIADDGATLQTEFAGMSFRLPRWPDVRLAVRARRNGDRVESSLLERRASTPLPAIYEAAAKRVKKLREGKRSVGPIAGEELLQAYPSEEGFYTHGFVWDSRGQALSADAPAITLEFDSGENPVGGGPRYIPPSLTDEQAIALFDRIVNSIRVRPTGDAPRRSAPDPQPPRPPFAIHQPLGTQAPSDTVCSQAGLWRCAHANALGGAERFFGEGQMLPPVLVPTPLSLLQKLKGDARNRLTATTWTLVAYPGDQHG